jgi:hypothetical protein
MDELVISMGNIHYGQYLSHSKFQVLSTAQMDHTQLRVLRSSMDYFIWINEIIAV